MDIKEKKVIFDEELRRRTKQEEQNLVKVMFVIASLGLAVSMILPFIAEI